MDALIDEMVDKMRKNELNATKSRKIIIKMFGDFDKLFYLCEGSYKSRDFARDTGFCFSVTRVVRDVFGVMKNILFI